jgi:hypothetical protein
MLRIGLAGVAVEGTHFVGEALGLKAACGEQKMRGEVMLVALRIRCAEREDSGHAVTVAYFLRRKEIA